MEKTDEKLLSECDVQTMRGSGPGGQHRNKTESAVRLTHRETGIVVRVEERRSQGQNIKIALERLRVALEKHFAPPPPPRRHTKPSRAVKERRLLQKKLRAATKNSRAKIRGD
jgi:protein subunit release factor B